VSHINPDHMITSYIRKFYLSSHSALTLLVLKAVTFLYTSWRILNIRTFPFIPIHATWPDIERNWHKR
jgi:hypothetical protein